MTGSLLLSPVLGFLQHNSLKLAACTANEKLSIIKSLLYLEGVIVAGAAQA